VRRIVIVLTAAVALAAAAAGCGGSEGRKAVARVGTTAITREQLDQTVEHFREEATREGKPFADTPGARRHLLGLLVYRARLEEGAAALGITVPNDVVERRLESAGGDEGDGGDAKAFLESSVRAQLLTEAVYRKLSARIHVADPQRRQERRNAALRRWTAVLATRFPVR
jgi:hypothetical protein